MRPEIELLLCCSRTQLSSEQMGRIRRLAQQNLDWNDLTNTAQWHHVTPLLYWQLKAICPELVPSEILDKLATNFQINVRRNLFLTAQLIVLLKAFSAHQVVAIPFKGSVLSTKIYQNIALRQFYDIDLLICDRDFCLAKKILLSQGYQPLNQLSDRQEKLRIKTNYESEFIHQKLAISVDLHWQIAPPYFAFPLHPQDILEQCEPLDLAGTKFMSSTESLQAAYPHLPNSPIPKISLSPLSPNSLYP